MLHQDDESMLGLEKEVDFYGILNLPSNATPE
jgi:hypothetical protein